MTGFEPGSSGIGSDRSANCATTTAPPEHVWHPNMENQRFADKNEGLEQSNRTRRQDLGNFDCWKILIEFFQSVQYHLLMLRIGSIISCSFAIVTCQG